MSEEPEVKVPYPKKYGTPDCPNEWCGYRCGCCCHCDCQTPCPNLKLHTEDAETYCGCEGHVYCHGRHEPWDCADFTTRDRWAREKAARLEQFIPLTYQKTIEIEAMRLTPDNAEAVAEWCGGTVERHLVAMGTSQVTVVHVPGYRTYLVDQYLVKSDDRFTIVEPEAFDYERVNK